MKKLTKLSLLVLLFSIFSFTTKAQTITNNYVGVVYNGSTVYVYADAVFTSKFTGSTISLIEDVTLQYPNGTLHTARYVFIVPFTGYTGGVPTGTAIYDTPLPGSSTSAPYGSSVNSYTFVSASPYVGN